jgi:hypothetical protein
MSDTIPVGAHVRVIKIPDSIANMPTETQAAFEMAMGKMFVVAGHNSYGHLELELGPEIDKAIGGFMNTIWIEPEFVIQVESD